MASAANSVKTKSVKTSNPNPLFIDCEIPAICQLWAYRLLLKKKLLRGHYDIFSDLGPEELEKIGISEQAQYMTPNQLERSLDHDADPQIPVALANNIAHLANMVGLSAFEQQLLALMVLIKMVEPLNQVCTAFRVLKIADVENWLALTLACPVPQVRAAIGTRSALISSGLLTLEPSIDFSEAFDFINVSFPRDLMQENQDPNQLMRDIVQLATPATLGMADYPHIAADLGILIPSRYNNGLRYVGADPARYTVAAGYDAVLSPQQMSVPERQQKLRALQDYLSNIEIFYTDVPEFAKFEQAKAFNLALSQVEKQLISDCMPVENISSTSQTYAFYQLIHQGDLSTQDFSALRENGLAELLLDPTRPSKTRERHIAKIRG